jgi:nucleotide-binding universal stress UspA family protein
MARPDPRARHRRLLLATDLSARGDRAVERAVQLARQWEATLIAVHAVENELLPEPELGRELARRRIEATELLASVAGHKPLDSSIKVTAGAAASAVVETGSENHCMLAVMAPAHDDLLGGALLGSTVDRVLRHAEQPVLVVKRRCEHPYRSVLVAVDLSKPSALALRTARELFPEAALAVVHAAQPPLPAYLGSFKEADGLRRERHEAIVALVEETLGDGMSREVEIVIEEGSPTEVITERLNRKPADLVVVGTQGATGIRRAVIGSTAERLIQALPVDVLAVRPQRKKD